MIFENYWINLDEVQSLYTSYHTHQQQKNKSIVVDQDRFQQVKSRIYIRSNIYENVEDDLRKHSSEQRKEAKLLAFHN